MSLWSYLWWIKILNDKFLKTNSQLCSLNSCPITLAGLASGYPAYRHTGITWGAVKNTDSCVPLSETVTSLVWEMAWFWTFYKIPGCSNGQTNLDSRVMHQCPSHTDSFLSLQQLFPQLQILLWLWLSNSFSQSLSLWWTSTSFDIWLKCTFDFLFPDLCSCHWPLLPHCNLAVYLVVPTGMCWVIVDTALHCLCVCSQNTMHGKEEMPCHAYMNERTNGWMSQWTPI